MIAQHRTKPEVVTDAALALHSMSFAAGHVRLLREAGVSRELLSSLQEEYSGGSGNANANDAAVGAINRLSLRMSAM